MIQSRTKLHKYYCVCPAGKRIIGMYAHTASILYFLGTVSFLVLQSSDGEERAGFFTVIGFLVSCEC